jgi:hypothetical protein
MKSRIMALKHNWYLKHKLRDAINSDISKYWKYDLRDRLEEAFEEGKGFNGMDLQICQSMTDIIVDKTYDVMIEWLKDAEAKL